MSSSQNNRQDRKRKKSYRSARQISSSAPPSSASSSYVPAHNYTTELTLANEPIKKDASKSSVDDEKVLNFLSKLQPRGSITVNNDLSHITLIVSSSESSLLDTSTARNILIDKFRIDDLLTTEGPPGSIDVLMTVYGRMANIAKAAVFTIFLLSAKINNLQKEVFTLKSSTYKAHLLLKNGEDVQGIKYIDVASLFTYDYNKDIHDVFIQGDLTSIFNFILRCLERKWNVDPSLIDLKPMFGIHLDPALKLKSKVNIEIKNRAQSKLLQYLYPTLRYECT